MPVCQYIDRYQFFPLNIFNCFYHLVYQASLNPSVPMTFKVLLDSQPLTVSKYNFRHCFINFDFLDIVLLFFFLNLGKNLHVPQCMKLSWCSIFKQIWRLSLTKGFSASLHVLSNITHRWCISLPMLYTSKCLGQLIPLHCQQKSRHWWDGILNSKSEVPICSPSWPETTTWLCNKIAYCKLNKPHLTSTNAGYYGETHI